MGLWLKNVRPVCFHESGNRSGVAISDGGTIRESPLPDDEVLDADGLFLSPGWTDLHVHIWHGGTDFSVPPDRAGLKSGVTALADAGSAGEATLHGLRKYIIERRPETIRAFINIGSIGLVACNRVPELFDSRFIDVERTLAAIDANRDILCGVKVRASGEVVGDWGISPVRIAKRVAESAGLPLMVHIGNRPPDLEEIFALLSPGDIVTHCYNGTAGGAVTRSSAVFEHACRLAGTGVLMDVGHGSASFDFGVAAKSIAGGLVPFSISTDLHVRNVDGPVHD
ncbi:MAG: amidohydrolase/deacetylase family metallohydrolase, partial [Albidovulum sp.]|nr:amidohydrolase/deacetylase family metallohydrolase [Albidovulum sp.]